jgi:hypothetical protein
MMFFELLQLARILLYYLRIEYLWHVFIMPLTNRNGIIAVACTTAIYQEMGGAGLSGQSSTMCAPVQVSQLARALIQNL